ncbi:hypothetical protein [Burkholderia glumae]|uniref:hypothetical protein n=1 Tax=Burkholderia glumae TaxID=337 RepID=UPI0020B42B36|nr:hypothetical protein [Burkholderia glumae]
MDTMLLKRTRHTEHAAQACIRCIEDTRGDAGEHDSPLLTVSALIRDLHQDATVDGQFWFVDDRAEQQQRNAAIGAWPLWISERARNDERPLFYLTQSPPRVISRCSPPRPRSAASSSMTSNRRRRAGPRARTRGCRSGSPRTASACRSIRPAARRSRRSWPARCTIST